MAYDDRQQSFECEMCGGNVTFSGTVWECDSCNWKYYEEGATTC